MPDRKKDIIIGILIFFLILETILIVILFNKQRFIPVKKIKKAKIAIVIDDWGYNLKNIKFIREVNFPVNISVLPFLRYSTEIATEAKLNNLEVILHLPLEPKDYRKVNVEKKVILTSMDKNKILAILNDALRSVPYSKGISNHMGSKATENRSLMKIIFSEMKRNKLYFLDSFVTHKSICEGLSKQMGLKFAKRSIFLDNKSNSYYIHKQLMSLLDIASRAGEAIGIGHDRKLTLQTIGEFIPKIDKEKFEIVFVSELVK
jgi:hypothetical protein